MALKIVSTKSTTEDVAELSVNGEVYIKAAEKAGITEETLMSVRRFNSKFHTTLVNDSTALAGKMFKENAKLTTVNVTANLYGGDTTVVRSSRGDADNKPKVSMIMTHELGTDTDLLSSADAELAKLIAG